MSGLGMLRTGLVAAATFLVWMPSGQAQDAAAGMELAQKWCNSCHGIGDEPQREQDVGPAFADLADKDLQYLYEAIDEPHDFMPEFPALKFVDFINLIAYIQTVE